MHAHQKTKSLILCSPSQFRSPMFHSESLKQIDPERPYPYIKDSTEQQCNLILGCLFNINVVSYTSDCNTDLF